MVFGWLRPEEDDDRVIGEISNDRGDHAVFDIPADGEDDVDRIMRDHGVRNDHDEQESRRYDAERRWERRDHDELRYRTDDVVDRDEDREPEEDDDTIDERDEQSASGGWWPFG
ncbi:hypothetical protein [Halomicronema sp. CCY15110]|uniref:hypothetical protein n=1 Tax=Halomicronema sp. CCY15110 TaxID=2767773 RepID=UPI00194F2349|nr:hypothetical protein [Halomicronema sp. CCY15110]